MSLTTASLDQSDAVLAIWQECGLTRPWNDAEADFRMALHGAASTVLLALEDDRIVGTIMVGFDGHRGWVYYLASAPDRRGTGIGRILMHEAEKWLRDLGAPKIQLMVRSDNSEALGFYRAIGYEVQDVKTIGRRLD